MFENQTPVHIRDSVHNKSYRSQQPVMYGMFKADHDQSGTVDPSSHFARGWNKNETLKLEAISETDK